MIRVVLGVREHERVPVRHEHAVDALCDRREERVRDVGDDEPDRVAGARPHAASGDVRAILERLHGVEHPPPGSVAHERVVVQDARDGRDGDPRPLCDFLDRRRHGQAVGNDFKRESMRAAAGESRSRQMRSPRAPRVSEATLRAGGSRGRSSYAKTVRPARPPPRDGRIVTAGAVMSPFSSNPKSPSRPSVICVRRSSSVIEARVPSDRAIASSRTSADCAA